MRGAEDSWSPPYFLSISVGSNGRGNAAEFVSRKRSPSVCRCQEVSGSFRQFQAIPNVSRTTRALNRSQVPSLESEHTANCKSPNASQRGRWGPRCSGRLVTGQVPHKVRCSSAPGTCTPYSLFSDVACPIRQGLWREFSSWQTLLLFWTETAGHIGGSFVD